MLRQLWYLSEELVALALFDAEVTPLEKAKIVANMINVEGSSERVLRPTVALLEVQNTWHNRTLCDFATSRTKRFFDILGMPSSFLDSDPELWSENDDYAEMREIVRNVMPVTNCLLYTSPSPRD